MSLMAQLRNVVVNNRRVSVPAQATPEEVIRLSGEDPHHKELVSFDGPSSFTRMHPKGHPISLREGDEFSTQLSGQGGF